MRVYNTKVESVPTNLIANMFKFEKATYFEVNDPTVRQAPNVSFGEIAYRGDAPGGSGQGQLPPQASAPPVQFGQPSDSLPDPQQYQQQTQQPSQGQPQQYQQPPPAPGGYQPPQT